VSLKESYNLSKLPEAIFLVIRCLLLLKTCTMMRGGLRNKKKVILTTSFLDLSYHANLQLPVFMTIVFTKKCPMSGDKSYTVNNYEIYNTGAKYFFVP